ncbi:hypothetical protein V5735_03575 (plasmid) [Haladaptatus sp. SPP-AMP-3]|uniref:hypothetical protein n=1 Tax=Haladaptatus sp. SPP-AMP-3 TaxID=3121295 RepID=UPI003C2F6ECB
MRNSGSSSGDDNDRSEVPEDDTEEVERESRSRVHGKLGSNVVLRRAPELDVKKPNATLNTERYDIDATDPQQIVGQLFYTVGKQFGRFVNIR